MNRQSLMRLIWASAKHDMIWAEETYSSSNYCNGSQVFFSPEKVQKAMQDNKTNAVWHSKLHSTRSNKDCSYFNLRKPWNMEWASKVFILNITATQAARLWKWHLSCHFLPQIFYRAKNGASPMSDSFLLRPRKFLSTILDGPMLLHFNLIYMLTPKVCALLGRFVTLVTKLGQDKIQLWRNGKNQEIPLIVSRCLNMNKFTIHMANRFRYLELTLSINRRLFTDRKHAYVRTLG